MHALTSYLKHVRDEFQHITWPTSRTAVAHTLVVIFISIVVTAFVGVLDYILGGVVSRIVGV